MTVRPVEPIRRPGRPRDDGFTLVEVMVTMLLAIVVLFAILQAAQFLDRTTAASSRLTDAQEQGRVAFRQLSAEARQAGAASLTTPLSTITRSSISFAVTTDGSSGAVAGWVRWCATTDGRLMRGQRSSAPSSADDLAACGVGGGWTYGTVLNGTLVDGTRLFSYTAPANYVGTGCPQQPITAAVPNPSPCLPAPASVTGVGIRLAVADRSASSTKTIVTRGAVSFRNRTQQ